MSKAIAEFEAAIDTDKKNKQPVRTKEDSGQIPTDLISGPAEVTIGRTIKKGIPYGEASISSTVFVKLPCGEDNKSVIAAGRRAKTLMERIQNTHAPDMVHFINEAMEQAIKRNRNLR